MDGGNGPVLPAESQMGEFTWFKFHLERGPSTKENLPWNRVGGLKREEKGVR